MMCYFKVVRLKTRSSCGKRDERNVYCTNTGRRFLVFLPSYLTFLENGDASQTVSFKTEVEVMNRKVHRKQ